MEQQSSQALTSQSNKDIMKKEIESLIEAVCLNEPGMKGRLNAQAVWNYLQLPDESFGWVDGYKGAMPWRVKVMSVMAHLQEGIQPGYGHILFIGNKLYMTAEFARKKFHEDSNISIKALEFIPLAPGEKEMYGLEEGDRAIKVILDGSYCKEDITWSGVGIIDRDELAKTDSKGRKMQMFGTKKNIMATLKTRAMADMLKYNYNTRIPIAPDHNEIIAIQESESHQTEINDFRNKNMDFIDRNNAKALHEAKQEEQGKEKIYQQILTLLDKASEIGYENEYFADLLELQNFPNCLMEQSYIFINNVLNQLSDFLVSAPNLLVQEKQGENNLKEKKEEEEKPKKKGRGRGRPKKSEQNEEEEFDEETSDVSEDELPEINLEEKPKRRLTKADLCVRGYMNHDKIQAYPELLTRLEKLKSLPLDDEDEPIIKDGTRAAVTQQNYDMLDKLIELRDIPF